MTLGRRELLTHGLAGLGLTACAPLAERRLVTVNLTTPTQAPPVDGPTLLETAFDAARRMTVPVMVQGRGPFQFVVDTGANRTVISQELAATLGLAPQGSLPVHGIAGVEPAPMFRLARLQVGGSFAYGVEAPGLPAAKLGADGLLGVDALRNRRVSLDFRNNRFEIATSNKGAAMGRGDDTRLGDRGPQIVSVPARYRFGQLVIVGADVAGAPVSAFLDSGAQISVGNLALKRAVLQMRPELAERFVQTPLISATGQTAMGEFAILPSLRLGSLKIQRLVAVFADLHIFKLWQLEDRPAILIGVDVLRQFDKVILDFGRREVTFQAPEGRRAPR